MKSSIKFLLIAFSAVLVSACIEEQFEENSTNIPMVTVTLNAEYPSPESDSETKTELGQDGQTPYWSVKDQIGVVSVTNVNGSENTANHCFANQSTVKSETTKFAGEVPEAESTLYCYFPYNKRNNSYSNTVELQIPSTQNPTVTSFDGRADLLIAKSLTNTGKNFDGSKLEFKRLTGILKVVPVALDKSLEEKRIQSVSLEISEGGPQIVGKVKLDYVNQNFSICSPLENEADKSNINHSKDCKKVTAIYKTGAGYIPDATKKNYESHAVHGTLFSLFPTVLESGQTLTITIQTVSNNQGTPSYDTFKRTFNLPNKFSIVQGKMNVMAVGISSKHRLNVQSDGTALAWQKFNNASLDNVLLDFSYAGYMRGEAVPPEIDLQNPNGYTVINIRKSFEGKPQPWKARQAFLDAINANPSGNVVFYFPEGEYILHDDKDPLDAQGASIPIQINRGNFIIKGDGKDKTKLIMNAPNQPRDPFVKYSSPDMILIKHKSDLGSIPVSVDVTETIKKGSRILPLTGSISRFISSGSWVCLCFNANYPSKKILNYEFGNQPYKHITKYPLYIVNSEETANTEQKEYGVIVKEYHQIEKYDPKTKTVTFYEPIMRDINSGEEGWCLRKFNCCENVGVEDLTFVGHAKDNFTHHASWEDDGAYKPLTFNRLVNSWIRRVGFESVSECVTMSSCANCSAYDIEVYGNRGHSGLRSAGSSRIFLGKIWEHSHGYNMVEGQHLGSEWFDDAGQYHASGVSKPSMGAVLWRNHWGKDATFESHSSQPRATLVDHCKGGWVEWRFGGTKEETPNHLNDLTIWNMETERFYGRAEQQGNYQWWNTSDEKIKWRVSPPIVVGFYGTAGITFDTTSQPAQMKYSESLNAPVWPESLYEAQLEKRLTRDGKNKAWLNYLKSNHWF